MSDSSGSVELEHASPRIGRVLFDPARQQGLPPRAVRLKVLSDGRETVFDKASVRPLLRPTPPVVTEGSHG